MGTHNGFKQTFLIPEPGINGARGGTCLGGNVPQRSIRIALSQKLCHGAG